MTKIFGVVSVAVVLGVSCDSVWAQQNDDSAKTNGVVVARVNGDAITQDERTRLLSNPLERRALLAELGVESAGRDELHRVALRKLIHRRLILHEAARRKFTVTEQELDKAVTSLRRRFADLKDFGAWMKQEGLDDRSLFTTIRDEMLAAHVRTALIADVRVTEEQLQQYYEAHKDDLRTDEVRLQIIVARDATAAQEILAALEDGGNFGDVARKRSTGRRATRGGDTGWVDSATLWPPLREAVSTMKVRQAGGPLQRGDEFLIVRLDGRRPGRARSLADARPDIERRLLPVAQQQALQAWLAQQEQSAQIEVLLESR